MPTAPTSHHSDLLHTFHVALGDSAGEVLTGALTSGVLWALMGALAGLIATAIIWRRSLLRRRPLAWNVLAKFSYLLVLIAFIGAAAGVGAVRRVQSDFGLILTGQLKPALAAKMPTVREFLAARMSKYAPDKRSLKDIAEILMEDLRYVPTSDTLWERTKARWVNWLIRKFGTEVIIDECRKIVIMKIEALGTAMKTDFRGRAQGELVQFGADLFVKLGTDATRNVDYTMLDKTVPDALIEVIQKTTDGYFRAALKMIFLIFTLVGLVVAAEMLAYFKWHLPRQKM